MPRRPPNSSTEVSEDERDNAQFENHRSWRRSGRSYPRVLADRDKAGGIAVGKSPGPIGNAQIRDNANGRANARPMMNSAARTRAFLRGRFCFHMVRPAAGPLK
jgi:hypothetical protein